MPNSSGSLLGPRVPPEEFARDPARYAAPNVILMVARVALLVSIFLPYWQMTLEAPQYPDDLHVAAYVNRLTGDVREIDGLNHYIGMRPLEEAARLERSLAVYSIIALVILMELAALIHNRWAALLCAPAVLFPVFFVADLAWWLNDFGQNLDPAAALSGAIEPFTPPIFGVGVIGQFRTVAMPGSGLILACAGVILVVVGLFFHRRAYKPLVERAGAEP
jgi:hypothetical protein